MVDLILKPIWNLLVEGWSNMADLADSIDDLICSFEGGGETTMDTVAMLMFGWMIFGLIVLAIGRYLYGRFLSSAGEEGKQEIVEEISPPAVSEEVITSKESRSASAVIPTPPIRKRVSRKSSGGTTPPKSPSLVSPPRATGPESESVKWVNEVFSWLYSDISVVNDIFSVWIQTLNAFTKKTVAEHGVGVEFVRILPETHSPSLSNVFSECSPNDDITITCDCEANPAAVQLKAFRQKGDKVEVSHYRVNINKLRARLNIACITERLLAAVKFDGWPEIKVTLAPVGTLKNNLDEQQLQDVLTEIVVTAIRNTFLHLNLRKFSNCPRFSRNIATAEPLLPVHYDSLVDAQPRPMPIPAKTAADKRLLVKVIKASGLGAKKGCTEPYCIVEMDEPPQRHQTTIKKDTNSPFWDEHFLFDLSPNTAEILFEIYDKANKGDNFLGLGIVGIEELLINPSQRQIISLQSRPYEADEVSGALTVEFLFIEGADIPILEDRPYKLKETLKTLSPTGAVITTTKTVFQKPGTTESMANGGDPVTDSALKELELRNKGGQPNASKSTLIIHSVQRKTPENAATQPEGVMQDGSEAAAGDNVPSAASDDRGRSRKKKRDFFGTIKKRLSRSKTRSKSVDPSVGDDSLSHDASNARSISADRARDHTDDSQSGGGHLTVPGKGLDGNSIHSSLSEASGVSGASTRTYVNEASTLVLETIENNIKKHYLVPLAVAQKSKWKKKGTKLHIYNDHTFIAKHLSGGTPCQVCTKSVARRIGKQGYECRDCQLKCHKHCHVKVESMCPSSTIQNIELSLLPVLSE